MMGMGGMGMMGGDDPDADDKMGEHGPDDEETRELTDFMDESLPTEQRMQALQEAIRLCVEKHVKPDALSGASYSSSDSGPAKKPGIDIAMVFGGPKKKG